MPSIFSISLFADFLRSFLPFSLPPSFFQPLEREEEKYTLFEYRGYFVFFFPFDRIDAMEDRGRITDYRTIHRGNIYTVAKV